MTTPDLAPFDFNGTWRDDMLHQQRIKLAGAEPDDRHAVADLCLQLAHWKERAIGEGVMRAAA